MVCASSLIPNTPDAVCLHYIEAGVSTPMGVYCCLEEATDMMRRVCTEQALPATAEVEVYLCDGHAPRALFRNEGNVLIKYDWTGWSE